MGNEQSFQYSYENGMQPQQNLFVEEEDNHPEPSPLDLTNDDTNVDVDNPVNLSDTQTIAATGTTPDVVDLVEGNSANHTDLLEPSQVDNGLKENPIAVDEDMVVPVTFRSEIDSVKELSIVDATRHLFPIGRQFLSSKQLIAMLNMFGETRGFTVSCGGGSKIICPKYGTHKYEPATVSQSRTNRNNGMLVHRSGRSAKCGCNFHINHSRKSKPPIRITSACYEHTNGCIPSADQLVSLRKKSGYYTRTNSAELRSVYIHLNSGMPVPASQIRDMLTRIIPRRVPWSSQDVWNIRISARRFRSSIASQDLFDRDVIPELHAIRNHHHSDALDNNSDDIVDKAVNEAQSLFEATLKESMNHTYSRFMVGNFMHKLKQCDPGFKYRVFYAEDNDMTGYVYQTTDMRRNFEKFGNFISIDMMKRQQNDLEWPYFGPVVVDGNNSVRVIGEACVVGETHEAYKAVLDVLFEFTPTRLRSSIDIIASDCFITQDFMDSMEMQNAKLIWDRYHLISHVWKYGMRRSYNKVREFLEKMIDVYSETKYLEAYNNALNLSTSVPNEREYLMNSIHANRRFFARYILKDYRGLMGKRGSSHSEQNHSSMISQTGKYFYDDLIHQLKRMLERQKLHCLRRRKLEADRILSLPSVISKLNKEHPRHNTLMSEAAGKLCAWGLELFIRQFIKSKDYKCVEQDGIKLVRYTKTDNANPRRIEGRCDCSDRLSFLIQCRHEIIYHDHQFKLDLFDVRWHRELTSDNVIETNDVLAVLPTTEEIVDEDMNDNVFEAVETATNTNLAHANINLLNTNSDNDLNIMTVTSIDDEINAMSPTAVNPQGFHLTKSARFKLLTDACNSYVKAWSNHPRFHDKALGYIVNGTNAILGKEVDPGKNLESLANSFHTSFASNTDGPMFLSAPRVGALRNSTGGRGITNRLTSSVERASKRARTFYNEPKRSGTGSQSKCSFCHSIGHTRTTCMERSRFGRDYSENASNLLHILTLPIHSIATYKYVEMDKPKPVPNIPVEASRIVITRMWIPRNNIDTTNDADVFVSLILYDNLLESADDAGGLQYAVGILRDWIKIHVLQSKSKKFSIHLKLDDDQSSLDRPIKRMEENHLVNEIVNKDDEGMIDT